MVWAAPASVVAKALRCFWKESDFFLRNRVLVAESAKKYDLTTNTKATKDYFLKLRASDLRGEGFFRDCGVAR
jgi:hypothetical protein